MKWIEFFDEKVSLEEPICGTDGIIIPDQRYSTKRLIEDVINGKYFIKHNATHFRIMLGNSIRERGTVIHEITKIK